MSMTLSPARRIGAVASRRRRPGSRARRVLVGREESSSCSATEGFVLALAASDDFGRAFGFAPGSALVLALAGAGCASAPGAEAAPRPRRPEAREAAFGSA